MCPLRGSRVGARLVGNRVELWLVVGVWGAGGVYSCMWDVCCRHGSVVARFDVHSLPHILVSVVSLASGWLTRRNSWYTSALGLEVWPCLQPVRCGVYHLVDSGLSGWSAVARRESVREIENEMRRVTVYMIPHNTCAL